MVIHDANGRLGIDQLPQPQCLRLLPQNRPQRGRGAAVDRQVEVTVRHHVPQPARTDLVERPLFHHPIRQGTTAVEPVPVRNTRTEGLLAIEEDQPDREGQRSRCELTRQLQEQGRARGTVVCAQEPLALEVLGVVVRHQQDPLVAPLALPDPDHVGHVQLSAIGQSRLELVPLHPPARLPQPLRDQTARARAALGARRAGTDLHQLQQVLEGPRAVEGLQRGRLRPATAERGQQDDRPDPHSRPRGCPHDRPVCQLLCPPHARARFGLALRA